MKPTYYLYGDRPVKMVPTADGGLDCLAFVWGSKGQFKRDMQIGAEIHAANDPDVSEISKATFDSKVAALSS